MAQTREKPATVRQAMKKEERAGSHVVRTSRGGTAKRGSGPGATAPSQTVYMTSTEAQNGFGRLLDTVAGDRTVLITKRNRPQAVVMSAERYDALTRETHVDLDALTAEFDEMVARMQTPESIAGVKALFTASSEELGRAAVEAANGNRR
jgi:antitoxin Phd